MKLVISLMLTAMMQPAVGQDIDYTNMFELVGTQGLCTANGEDMSDLHGSMPSQAECFAQCTSHAWCLGISSKYRPGLKDTWCELVTSSDISCMDPPLTVPGFVPRCFETPQCPTLSECSITGSNGITDRKCYRKTSIDTASLAPSLISSETPSSILSVEPSSDTATLFYVGQVTSSSPWQVGTEESNTVTVPFVLQDISASDADFFAAADSVGCLPEAITVDAIEGTQSDVATGLPITFVNEKFAATQIYCVRVKLMFGTQPEPIASSMIEFTATSSTSGSVSVAYTINGEDLQIKTNEVVAAQTIDSIVDSYIPTIIMNDSTTSNGPIYFGRRVTIGVEKGPDELDDFDLDITGINLIGATDFTAQNSLCSFKIPIQYFDDETVTINLNVAWSLDVQGNSRRLQDTSSGSETVPVTFELVSVNGSGGYKIAMISNTLIALGGVGLGM